MDNDQVQAVCGGDGPLRFDLLGVLRARGQPRSFDVRALDEPVGAQRVRVEGRVVGVLRFNVVRDRVGVEPVIDVSLELGTAPGLPRI